MSTTEIQAGITKVAFQDALWTVEEVKGRGWLTLVSADDVQVKARVSQVEILVPEDEEEDSETDMSSHIRKYRSRYTKAVSSQGKSSLHNNDLLAKYLEGRTVEEAFALCEYWCELEQGSLTARYMNLKNDGMRRMNAGNRLRSLIKRADDSAQEPGMAEQFVEWLRNEEERVDSVVYKGVFYRFGMSEQPDEPELVRIMVR